MILFSILGSIGYHTVCEGLHGCTLGKRLLGMIVVQEDGSPSRLNPAFIRSLAFYVDGLFFGVIGYMAMKKTPQEQRHGDNWAHTMVCRRSDVSTPPNRSFALILIAAIAIDSLLLAAGLILS